MTFPQQIEAARQTANSAEARIAAHEAGVVPDRIDVFLRAVDLGGNPDAATVRARVRATLADLPEFDSRRRPVFGDRPAAELGTGNDLRTQVAASLAGMQSSVGIASPADPASTAPAALVDQVADVLARMKSAVGI